LTCVHSRRYEKRYKPKFNFLGNFQYRSPIPNSIEIASSSLGDGTCWRMNGQKHLQLVQGMDEKQNPTKTTLFCDSGSTSCICYKNLWTISVSSRTVHQHVKVKDKTLCIIFYFQLHWEDFNFVWMLKRKTCPFDTSTGWFRGRVYCTFITLRSSK
jgi:hypothetical protein